MAQEKEDPSITIHVHAVTQDDSGRVSFALTRLQVTELLKVCAQALAEDEPYDAEGFLFSFDRTPVRQCRAHKPACEGGEARLLYVRRPKRERAAARG